MNTDIYRPVKDKNGEDYLCPVSPDAAIPQSPVADCVEKDVTERYSGNFVVEGKKQSATITKY
ncbi:MULTISPECIES: hypothetical protein [Desulfococcus]|jgi:hypothetical protein|uniref:Uncharacterized protein n=1 Tax=Desulfococcus multivorans DSM 2059 TaxID=1121405 RepID=S7UX61_DESML|nr:hypothetical protein [Desulfococcus multivorans]AOY57682.1 uncharacterized protein Dmul_09070 [Desulfococcus multivorans]AQV00083.1 hypothetical protein B2D07_04375 [Desulfococcus multivorans]EPR38764.1 hypothetical protein dsmv_0174 [Desulfococcus multivorans DSM 2059]MDX9818205.1 hypothetical protein [Desulfococcus multivorans]SJZ78777.1 hypothetical protein SAMN02745446_01664 [Desulfococcus multivorans DSM 2059]